MESCLKCRNIGLGRTRDGAEPPAGQGLTLHSAHGLCHAAERRLGQHGTPALSTKRPEARQQLQMLLLHQSFGHQTIMDFAMAVVADEHALLHLWQKTSQVEVEFARGKFRVLVV